jgi:hypothetical protein
MDKFRTDFPVASLAGKINYQSKIVFTGSCFSENIADKLLYYKFSVISNPCGIIYNPVSLANELRNIIELKCYSDDDVFEDRSIYRSFDFHSRFAHPDKNEALGLMNYAVTSANKFLKSASHLFITFGTSIAYKFNPTGQIVANNHKLPADNFTKIILKPDEIIEAWKEILSEIRRFNADINIIFTVSPVRHLRDGAIENSRSKATLIYCVSEITQQFNDSGYFPAYEIMVDDLRDYRFYKKDLIHPNETAIDYIWEKFKDAYINNSCFDLMNTIEQIKNAMRHKPFFPDSKEHRQFMKNMIKTIRTLSEHNPEFDFTEELKFFDNN